MYRVVEIKFRVVINQIRNKCPARFPDLSLREIAWTLNQISPDRLLFFAIRLLC
jgi:hypothetical protein